tara:strand:+ start:540 stop:947 length:408 start_codon:yes stop_codon:yes gene_type:complete
MDTKELDKIGSLIQRIFTSGINLGDLTDKESEDYLLDFCQFINKDRVFKANFQDNKVIVETFNWEPIMAIRIYKGTLQLTPLSENSFFETFMLILGYVSAKSSIKEFIDEIDLEKLGVEEALGKEKVDVSEFDWI